MITVLAVLCWLMAAAIGACVLAELGAGGGRR